MNPKEVFHNTAYSVQQPYIPDHSLEKNVFSPFSPTFPVRTSASMDCTLGRRKRSNVSDITATTL